jgi:uncharacterized protein YfaS (alpha-2-macroglobulin family)
MPAEDTSAFRRIVLSGLGAGAPMSEMAISLVDKAGNTLSRDSVNEDGNCELSEEALAVADWVLLEPAQAFLEAEQFRRLIETDTLDVAALLREQHRDPGPKGW